MIGDADIPLRASVVARRWRAASTAGSTARMLTHGGSGVGMAMFEPSSG